MNDFNHRYELAFAGQEETAAELRAQLVTVGAQLATAELENGRAQTRFYRLLSASERLLRGELSMVDFEAMTKGERK